MNGQKYEYTWLFDDVEGLKQKLRFKDRIEYRVNGRLHNTKGPAYISFSDDKKKTKGEVRYYINGEKVNENEWSILTRPTKLKKIIKNIKNKKEEI